MAHTASPRGELVLVGRVCEVVVVHVRVPGELGALRQILISIDIGVLGRTFSAH
jgi:hypothetical protein